jgi:hypothetical protein
MNEVRITIQISLEGAQGAQDRESAVEAIVKALQPWVGGAVTLEVRDYGSRPADKSEPTKATSNLDPYNKHIDPGF